MTSVTITLKATTPYFFISYFQNKTHFSLCHFGGKLTPIQTPHRLPPPPPPLNGGRRFQTQPRFLSLRCLHRLHRPRQEVEEEVGPRHPLFLSQQHHHQQQQRSLSCQFQLLLSPPAPPLDPHHRRRRGRCLRRASQEEVPLHSCMSLSVVDPFLYALFHFWVNI